MVSVWGVPVRGSGALAASADSGRRWNAAPTAGGRAAMERSPYRGKRQACRRQDGGSPYGRAGARPSRAETNGGRAVLRGGVERRFLDTANCGRVELCEGEALGAKVFQRRADEIEFLVVDDEEAVVESFVVAHGEFRVLRVEGRDVGGGNLAVGHMLLVVML